MALGCIEQQRDPRVEGDVAAVLGKVGEQQQRTRIEIDREQHQGCVGGAAEARRERRARAAPRQ
jgi:hypothetical protein